MKQLNRQNWKKSLSYGLAAATALSTSLTPFQMASASTVAATTTPIQHIVVLFQENVSFDHYFGTYPKAANNSGETTYTGVIAPTFTAKTNTPGVNGLTTALLTHNENKDTNGNQANPFRFLPSQAYSCSQNHAYTGEESAADAGLQDKFPQNNNNRGNGCDPAGSTVMGYNDGNMVTAYWNYAQHYAMSDNTYGTNFGPSTPGALNVISGSTYGGQLPFAQSSGSAYDPNGTSSETDVSLLNDLDAYLDDCGGDKGGTVKTAATLQMTGKNVGDLLNAKGISWGWFQGGFAPTSAAVLDANGNTVTPAVCGSVHIGHQVTINGSTYVVPLPTINNTGTIYTNVSDYSSHHSPFMYYASTSNPHHLRPSSVAAIGTTDQANHNYDTSDFFAALANGNLPAVSYVKAPAYQDGHPGNSDPLVEQAWISSTINAIQASSAWPSTAVIIAYDDSDGWYDHVSPTNVRTSAISADTLTGAGQCGATATGGVQGRCGFGPRLPLIIVSPYAKYNYVDHTLVDQSSIVAFIEQNWNLGYIDGPTAPTYGAGSTDRYAGSINGLFDFVDAPNTRQLQLNPVTGVVTGKSW